MASGIPAGFTEAHPASFHDVILRRGWRQSTSRRRGEFRVTHFDMAGNVIAKSIRRPDGQGKLWLLPSASIKWWEKASVGGN